MSFLTWKSLYLTPWPNKIYYLSFSCSIFKGGEKKSFYGDCDMKKDHVGV